MKINSLKTLFHEELKDIYDAEKRLTKALPKIMKACNSEKLKAALKSHLAATITQVVRLETIFELLGAKPVSKPCLAMKGLLEEGEEAMTAEGSLPFTDILIIGAARRVEHYEMAAYLSLRDIAAHLELTDVEKLLSSTLLEESEADEALSEISMTLMNESEMSANTQKKSPATQAQPEKRKAANA